METIDTARHPTVTSPTGNGHHVAWPPRQSGAPRRPDSSAGYLRPASANTDGRACALTVLTPVPRFWFWIQRLVLRTRSLFRADRLLQSMAFIHFAHWVTIRRFPDAERRNRYGYLMFQSNFNGAWSKYIDAFAVLIPTRMAVIWTTSFGFPGALPPKPFRRYIAHNDRSVDHYYSAYPEASVTEITSALRVVEPFLGEVLPAANADPATFARAWRRFITEAQCDLPAGGAPDDQ